MAQAVEFREFTPTACPNDQEALQSANRLLQKLHEKGVIDSAGGLLDAGDTIVDALTSRQAVAALRVALIVGNVLESLDTDRLHSLLAPSNEKPPSLWSIWKQARSEDGRRGLAAAVGLLQVLGAALHRDKP